MIPMLDSKIFDVNDILGKLILKCWEMKGKGFSECFTTGRMGEMYKAEGPARRLRWVLNKTSESLGDKIRKLENELPEGISIRRKRTITSDYLTGKTPYSANSTAHKSWDVEYIIVVSEKFSTDEYKKIQNERVRVIGSYPQDFLKRANEFKKLVLEKHEDILCDIHEKTNINSFPSGNLSHNYIRLIVNSDGYCKDYTIIYKSIEVVLMERFKAYNLKPLSENYQLVGFILAAIDYNKCELKPFEKYAVTYDDENKCFLLHTVFIDINPDTVLDEW